MAKVQKRPLRVFISYRRDDAPQQAQLLWKYFAVRYRNKNVFFDREGISAGAEFSDEINRKIRECDVLVAVIGPRWIELIKDYAIEQNDYVRNEIALALAQKKLVVPVCIGGAQTPDVKQMHWQVRPMMTRNAEVLPDPFRDAEVRRLLSSIEETFFQREDQRREAAKLDETSPAAGLALGYFVNFIRKTVRLITAKTPEGDRYANTIKITELDGEPFYLGNDLQSRSDLRLHIVLPPQLECIRLETLKPALQSLPKGTVNQPGGDRPYSCQVWKVAGQYGIIDFPTPYLVMDEWIQRRKAQGTPAQPPSHWQNLEADELGRFETVLRSWVEDSNEESDFRDRIHFIRFTDKKHYQQWLDDFRAPSIGG
ncbi:MAG: toll/interleukin-1 receptor domain-containing protein [Verrucomicrobia bacterium]|nr:toll/interleukin-1 receptor domain-containing protein [Verrucomicrobiota bacterium]